MSTESEDLTQTVPESWRNQPADTGRAQALRRNEMTIIGNNKSDLAQAPRPRPAETWPAFGMSWVVLMFFIVPWTGRNMTGAESPLAMFLIGAVFSALLACVYIIPTWLASGRRHRNVIAVMLLNVFGGWTVLGWIAALVWAAVEQERRDSRPQ